MRRPTINLLWLLPWILLTWVSFEVLWLCLFLPGLLVFPLALRFAGRAYVPTKLVKPGQTPGLFPWVVEAFTNPLLDAWLGNYEDGLLPGWWREKGGTQWSWFLRNPISNMRFWPIVSCRPDPSRIRWIGDDRMAEDGVPCRFVAWQGAYGGVRIQGKRRALWVGWKVKPQDRFGVSDYRAWGIGVAAQWVRFPPEA